MAWSTSCLERVEDRRAGHELPDTARRMVERRRDRTVARGRATPCRGTSPGRRVHACSAVADRTLRPATKGLFEAVGLAVSFQSPRPPRITMARMVSNGGGERRGIGAIEICPCPQRRGRRSPRVSRVRGARGRLARFGAVPRRRRPADVRSPPRCRIRARSWRCSPLVLALVGERHPDQAAK